MRPSGRAVGRAAPHRSSRATASCSADVDDDDEHLLKERERERAMKWALNIQDAAATAATAAPFPSFLLRRRRRHCHYGRRRRELPERERERERAELNTHMRARTGKHATGRRLACRTRTVGMPLPHVTRVRLRRLPPCVAVVCSGGKTIYHMRVARRDQREIFQGS